MGRPEARQAMQKGLAMGADKLVLVTDPALAGSDLWATGYVLAEALKKLHPWDVVLFGMQATDARGGQVPAVVAGLLGLPSVQYVTKLDLAEGAAKAHRLTKSGYNVIECKLPAVFMITKACNEPRYPSLKGIMAAKRKETAEWHLADIGVPADQVGMAGARTKVVAVSKPAARAQATIVKDYPDAAAKVFAYLRDRKVL